MKTIYNKLFFLLFLLPFSILAQSTLDGTVVDQKTKQPIPGVNVLVQGSPGGTQTDFDGKFKLANVKKGDKVVFSYIGYKNQVVVYDGQKTLSILLTEDSNELKEVVVQVGYGSVKKKDATGSVAIITAKDFNKGAIISTDQLLAGKASGVRITTDGGQPDAAPNIRIRGGASLSASNNPLIVIDGVPIGDLNPAGVSNPFSLINPNDVESFSILKDASATAIYGVRASNGVILITTKKGSSGAPQFTFSTSVSIGEIGKKLGVMNGTDFVRFIQEYHPAKVNLLGIDDPNDLDDNFRIDPITKQIKGRILYNTDWQDQILRTAISSDYNFSARANLYKKIPFRVSLGYNNSQGLIKTSDYNRFSYSIKMTPKLLNDNLKVDLNAKGTYTDKNAIDEDGALGSALNMDPTKPVFGNSYNNKFSGFYQDTKLSSGKDVFNGSTNPLALLLQRSRPERVVRFLGNVEFDYKIPFIKNLRAVLNLGLDASQSKIREVYSDNALATYRFDTSNPLTAADPTKNYIFNPGVNYLESQTNTNKTMDAYLVYSKELSGTIRKYDIQGGYSYQNFITDGDKTIYRYDEANKTGVREIYIEKSYNPTNRYYNPLNLQAFFARTNIDFLSKYLFTATFRADGTSIAQKDKRWGYFPAVGFAWKLKEESLFKESKFIQDLKFRVGWGKTGQANIANTDGVGYFPSRPLFLIGNVNSQYLSGVNATYTALPFNEDITWEKTTTINLGLDFEFFKNSILNGSVELYKRKTTDLLAVVPAAPGQSTGGTEFIKNVGSTDSKGIETNLSLKAVRTDNFNLTLNGNIAYNYIEVSDLNGISVVKDKASGLNQTGVFLNANPVGYEAYSAVVYEQLYNTNGQPIVGAYKDLNNDGKITSDDTYYKPLRPNWTYGFSSSINYKNLDLTANFRGQIGGQMYKYKTLTNGFVQGGAPLTSDNLNNVLNFYDGTASPLFNDFNGNATFSDYLLEDATFLRCDNITLAYKIDKIIKSSSLRLSASVNNAFIITKYTGQDPENFSSIDRKLYPRPKTFTFGVTLDF
jgi:TonB-dependent starch-binding outer membrane protein SusC